MVRVIWSLAGTLWLVMPACHANGDRQPFVRAIVVGHHLWTHSPSTDGQVRIFCDDLTGDPVSRFVTLLAASGRPSSLAASKSALWLTTDEKLLTSLTPQVTDETRRFSAAEFCAGRWRPLDAAARLSDSLVGFAGFSESSNDQAARAEQMVGAGGTVQRDVIPLDDFSALRFELFIPQKKTRENEGCRMVVARIERFVGKNGKVSAPTRKVLEEFDVPFRESFQAIVVGNQFHFMTHSGEVFDSVNDESGMKRRTQSRWRDERLKPSMLISDMNAGTHFVCGGDGKGWYCDQVGQSGLISLNANTSVSPVFPNESALAVTQALIRKRKIVLP